MNRPTDDSTRSNEQVKAVLEKKLFQKLLISFHIENTLNLLLLTVEQFLKAQLTLSFLDMKKVLLPELHHPDQVILKLLMEGQFS